MVDAAERLQLLYELTRRLASFDDLDALVAYATRRVRELFQAEGSSILLLDAPRREFRFPVASLSASGGAAAAALRELRFPADKGIAGWVLAHGDPVIVEDARTDSRFYGGVDRETGMTTRAMLAAPLRARTGTIGVIEVINPASGAFGTDDARFLEAVASDIAVAYEKTDLYARVQAEVVSLRQLTRLTGGGFLLIGLCLAATTTFATLAVALPLHRVLGRAPFIAGVLAALAGGALLHASRRR